MVKVHVVSCVTCGAPLRLPGKRDLTTCVYCGSELAIERSGDRCDLRDTRTDDAPPLAAVLLRGYQGHEKCGTAQRHDVDAMKERDWRAHEHGVWPISGHASSQFGSGWSARTIVGAPRVYPRCGDRMGAWAPGARHSKVEWIEATYPSAPPVRAIRVFETNMAGATFAVTVQSDDSDDPRDEEELVWCARPRAMHGAQVLEIELPAPRRIRRVRAYVDNTQGHSWSEIDTICLLATEPVPPRLRKRPPFLTARGWILATLGVAFVLSAVWVATCAPDERASPLRDSSTWGPHRLDDPPDAEGAAQNRMEPWYIDASELPDSRVVWTASVLRASSQYGDSGWSAGQVRGAPNVYPRHGDITQAWAPRSPDAGTEWIEVALEETVRARALVVVETFNPGALVRIDDISDPERPLVLWRGATKPSPGRSRLLRLRLAMPRRIARVRLVLDTQRVRGWNEIDAIGALPAPSP